MNTTLTDDEKAALVALDDNLGARTALLGQAISGAFVSHGSLFTLVDTYLPSRTYNIICRLRLEGPEGDETLARLLTYRGERAGAFTWWVGPCERPTDLADRLEAAGLRSALRHAAMTRTLEDLPEPDSQDETVTVRRVENARDIYAFSTTLARLWSPPHLVVPYLYGCATPLALAPDSPMRLYLAIVDGAAVCVGEAFLSGDSVGFYGVTTLESHRGRGIATRLMHKALQDARRDGAVRAVLQASPMGEPIYRRLGFKSLGHYDEYQ